MKHYAGYFARPDGGEVGNGSVGGLGSVSGRWVTFGLAARPEKGGREGEGRGCEAGFSAARVTICPSAPAEGDRAAGPN